MGISVIIPLVAGFATWFVLMAVYDFFGMRKKKKEVKG